MNSQAILKKKTSTTPFHWFLVCDKITDMQYHEIPGHKLKHVQENHILGYDLPGRTTRNIVS